MGSVFVSLYSYRTCYIQFKNIHKFKIFISISSKFPILVKYLNSTPRKEVTSFTETKAMEKIQQEFQLKLAKELNLKEFLPNPVDEFIEILRNVKKLVKYYDGPIRSVLLELFSTLPNKILVPLFVISEHKLADVRDEYKSNKNFSPGMLNDTDKKVLTCMIGLYHRLIHLVDRVTSEGTTFQEEEKAAELWYTKPEYAEWHSWNQQNSP